MIKEDMELTWQNPFTGISELVTIDKTTRKSDGTFRIPVSLYDSGIWDLALKGLQSKEDDQSKFIFALMIINILDPHDKLVRRQISPVIMSKISAFHEDKAVSNTTDAKKLVLYSQFKNYDNFIKEAIYLLFGKPDKEPKPSKETTISISFINDVIKAFNETHSPDLERHRAPRKFRDRYSNLIKKYNLTEEDVQKIRKQSYTAIGDVYHKIAQAFLQATSNYYDEKCKQIFRMLHFNIPVPTLDTTEKSIPPIASFESFNPIVKLYKTINNRNLLSDIARFVADFDESNQDVLDERHMFLSRCLGTIRWYRNEYLELVRADDNRDYKEKYIEDIETIFDSQNSYDHFSDDRFIDLLDARRNGGTVSDRGNEEQNKSMHHWLRQIYHLGWNVEDFMKISNQKCTKNQIILLRHLFEYKMTPEEIGTKLGKKRQTVQESLSKAIKKIGPRT